MKRLLILLTILTCTNALAATRCPQPPGNKIRICWQNSTTRTNGTPLARDEINAVWFFVNGNFLINATGAQIDQQWREVTLNCYRAGSAITARTISNKYLAQGYGTSPDSAPYYLPAKAGTTCNK